MEVNHVGIWNNCLKVIKDNIALSAYNVWFAPIKPVKFENNVLTIQVPSHFFYEWLEEHYITLLKKVIKRVIGNEGRLEYSIVMENNTKNATPYTVKLPASNTSSIKNEPINAPMNIGDNPIRNPFIIPGLKKVKVDSNLNTDYTFENFVEGDCNRLANQQVMQWRTNLEVLLLILY